MNPIAAIQRAIAHLRSQARWAPTAVAMGIVLVAYGVWQSLSSFTGHRALIGDAFFYAVALTAILSFLGASGRCRAQPRLRSAWLLLTLAGACYLAGDLAQSIYQFVGRLPYPSVADLLFLAFYPVAFCAFLRFAPKDLGASERTRLRLDLAVVAVTTAALMTYVALGPTVLKSSPNPFKAAVSIAYPVGDMILLVGLGYVLLRGNIGSSRRALQFLAAGALFFVAADIIYNYIQLHSVYHDGDPVDSLWMIGVALFAIAGAAQKTSYQTVRPRSGMGLKRPSWLPYVAVAVGFGLLIFSERHDAVLPATVMVSAVVLATLVSVRQLLAQRDLLVTQSKLRYESMHDPLTGLPNRALIMDRMAQMLARARRARDPIAALYVDLDAFKQVNDTLGHGAGDELLRVVSDRLSDATRETDTVGRLAGDEFVLLLEPCTPGSTAEHVAERICEGLRVPVELADGEAWKLSITASIGIALGLDGSADELLHNADSALYEAKREGKDRWVMFDHTIETVTGDKIGIAIDLEQALERDELFLVYQPLFDLESGSITGVEALIRLRHPVHGVIPPGRFIPLAEHAGMIGPIGRWVLRKACQTAVGWRDSGRPIGMSVNVSAYQLDDRDLVGDVAEALELTGLDAGALTLEITETALMRDADDAALRLEALKRLGVRIAIDDFGTGYSSLAYLDRFPVDALKIDRSFVSGIAGSRDSKAIIHALVWLGKSLGLETLAEGIEQTFQLDYLRAEQCDTGQGFLLGRPLAPEQIDDLLATEPALTTG